MSRIQTNIFSIRALLEEFSLAMVEPVPVVRPAGREWLHLHSDRRTGLLSEGHLHSKIAVATEFSSVIHRSNTIGMGNFSRSLCEKRYLKLSRIGFHFFCEWPNRCRNAIWRSNFRGRC